MFHTVHKARFLLIGLTASGFGSACSPTMETHNPFATVVPKFINYDLKITKVADGDYNELSPVRVEYEFTPTVNGPSIGVTRPIHANSAA